MSSQIRSEINTLIKEIKTNDETGVISAKFIFPESFSGFKGHFPQNPLLPGICQVQCAICLLSKALHTDLRLLTLEKAKFLNTIVPNEEIIFSGTKNIRDEFIEAKFTITKQIDNQRVNISRMHIKCVKR